jgi:hypothetical protein
VPREEERIGSADRLNEKKEIGLPVEPKQNEKII